MPDQYTEDIYALALRALEEDDDEIANQAFQADANATRMLNASELEAAQSLTPPPSYRKNANVSHNNHASVTIVTSDELAQRMPPLPRLFKNERPTGVRPAYAGEVRYLPVQPKFSSQTIVALVSAIVMVCVIAYGSLAFAGKLPLPAVLMYGSSRSAGVSMSSVANFTQAPHYKPEEFSSDREAAQYLDFSEQLLSSTEQLAKSYGALGKEMAKGGVPDLQKIKQLAQESESVTQQVSRDLNALVVPDLYSAEGKQYLEKSLRDAKAMIKQGNSTISALYAASSGRLSGFGDAGFSSSNINRNKETMFADLNRAARAVGLKERESK